MTTDEPPAKTEVSNRGVVTIPAAVRRRLDIEPGDKLQWAVTTDGDLSVEVVRQHYGAFAEDDKKTDLGGDSAETHDLTSGERI
jgi:antitoxin PrlF